MYLVSGPKWRYSVILNIALIIGIGIAESSMNENFVVIIFYQNRNKDINKNEININKGIQFQMQ